MATRRVFPNRTSHTSSDDATTPSIVERLEGRQLFATIVGVEGKSLITVDSVKAEDIISRVSIQNLLRKETITAIDFQPNTGRLYGLSSTNRLYLINPTTGATTNVGPGGAPLTSAPAGTDFGLDINDVSEIRILSGSTVHSLYGLDAGGIVTVTTTKTAPTYNANDGSFGQTPDIVAISHTFTSGQPNLTTVYGIDRALGNLVQVGSEGGSPDSPDTGLLTTIGSLGQPSIVGRVPFDILGASDAFVGLAAGPKAKTQLFGMNLATGGLTSLGDIGKANRPIVDFAVLPIGTPILTTDNKVIKIADSSLPSVPFFTSPAITGLQKKERFSFLSQQSSTDAVFGYTNQSRLYSINVQTGVVAALGQSADFVPAKNEKAAGDIDPVENTMRIVTTAGRNFRINLSDASVIDADLVASGIQFDTNVNYPAGDPNQGTPPAVTGVAYTQAIPNATFTAPFGIDQNLDILATISTPDAQLSTTANLFQLGVLGRDVKQVIGFDIATTTDGSSNTAWLAFKGKGGNFLTTVDLNTGATTDPLRFSKSWKPLAMNVFR